jgi:hypothetical protein
VAVANKTINNIVKLPAEVCLSEEEEDEDFEQNFSMPVRMMSKNKAGN